MKENVKLAVICLAHSEKLNIANLLLYKTAMPSSDELERNQVLSPCSCSICVAGMFDMNLLYFGMGPVLKGMLRWHRLALRYNYNTKTRKPFVKKNFCNIVRLKVLGNHDVI